MMEIILQGNDGNGTRGNDEKWYYKGNDGNDTIGQWWEMIL